MCDRERVCACVRERVCVYARACASPNLAVDGGN